MKKKRTKHQKVETRETILRVGFLAAVVLTVLFVLEGGTLFGNTASYVSAAPSPVVAAAEAATPDAKLDYDELKKKCEDPTDNVEIRLNDEGHFISCAAPARARETKTFPDPSSRTGTKAVSVVVSNNCPVVEGDPYGQTYGKYVYEFITLGKTLDSEDGAVDFTSAFKFDVDGSEPKCRNEEEAAQNQLEGANNVASKLGEISSLDELREAFGEVGNSNSSNSGNSTAVDNNSGLTNDSFDQGFVDAFSQYQQQFDNSPQLTDLEKAEQATSEDAQPSIWENIFGGRDETLDTPPANTVNPDGATFSGIDGPSGTNNPSGSTDSNSSGASSDSNNSNNSILDNYEAPLITFDPAKDGFGDQGEVTADDYGGAKASGGQQIDIKDAYQQYADSRTQSQNQSSSNNSSSNTSNSNTSNTPTSNFGQQVQSTLGNLTKGLQGGLGGLTNLLGGLLGQGSQSENNNENKEEETKGSTTETAKQVGGVEPGDPTLTCPSVKVDRGEDITIGWDCPNGTGSSGFRFTTDGDIAGVKTIPADHDEYGLFCNGEAKVCQIDLNDPELTLGVQPDELEVAGPVDVVWITSGVIEGSCALTADTLSDFSEDIDDRGSLESPTLASTTVFTLACTSLGDNPVAASTTVTVQ